jgi:hypothetical protein
MTKEEEIMAFLHERVFDPIRNSPRASRSIKSGVNLTFTRMDQRDAKGMIQYFWSAIVGTEHSVRFADLMKEEGFDRFEEVLEDFRKRFTDEWLEK